ncbi:RRQRL motif-containing zinc-binding protein [Micromonospora sp. NPDC047465]|uniref:RRQRL motif-containing zinc-binding protein n=1 Tax=Micromonospora sp. NPDC047465 TaxID=3154813 RepID=UPI0033C19AD6
MSRIRAVFYDPEGTRYGIPTYWWRGAPAGYATARQLRAQGLRPGGQPIAAQVMWRGVGGERVAYLYKVDQAAVKRTATTAQLAAIGKALAARRTCPTCLVMQPYYIPRSLGECLDCAEPPMGAAR